MSRRTTPTPNAPAVAAQLLPHLAAAGAALKAIRGHVTPDLYPFALEMVRAASLCRNSDELAEIAGTLARYGERAKARRAPVLRLVEGAA